MCLKITRDKPYNKSRIGYKVLLVRDGKYHSYFRKHEWENKSLTATGASDYPPIKNHEGELIVSFGVHIFTKLDDAKKFFTESSASHRYSVALVRVKVKGFLGAGEHYNCSNESDGKPGEVWAQATVLNEITQKGYQRGYQPDYAYD